MNAGWLNATLDVSPACIKGGAAVTASIAIVPGPGSDPIRGTWTGRAYCKGVDDALPDGDKVNATDATTVTYILGYTGDVGSAFHVAGDTTLRSGVVVSLAISGAADAPLASRQWEITVAGNVGGSEGLSLGPLNVKGGVVLSFLKPPESKKIKVSVAPHAMD